MIPDGVGSWGWSQMAAAGCHACGAGLRVVPTPAVAEHGSPWAGQPAPATLPQCRGPPPRCLPVAAWEERSPSCF